MDAGEKIIVALDVNNLSEAARLVKILHSYVVYFKVGLEILTSVGPPQAVKAIHDLGGKVVLDGKFNDIPNTVGKAVKVASRLDVEMLTVMASAGRAVMEAAVENKGDSLVLAVTVLTSLDEHRVSYIFNTSTKKAVLRLASIAKSAGVDGIICSPRDLEYLRSYPDLKNLLKVTPSVRPIWAAKNDQARITTPAQAIKNGANYIVVGRPITQPQPEVGTPVKAVQLIRREIEEALEEMENDKTIKRS